MCKLFASKLSAVITRENLWTAIDKENEPIKPGLGKLGLLFAAQIEHFLTYRQTSLRTPGQNLSLKEGCSLNQVYDKHRDMAYHITIPTPYGRNCSDIINGFTTMYSRIMILL
ncbi:hypothetical protein NQ317_010775 [Molorchus minor]|uniref:Uncharacterized protein n=1 Tax=Molorchus minor TaxID=1323400 RepID=A0ABQ9J9N6_9CUCU|nr:hypothetical protein NQ317_010775 [Molorchus minor]